MENALEKNIFSFVGGDRRQAVIADMLSDLGYKVKTFGLSEYVTYCPDAEQCASAEKALDGSDILILPLPVSRDGTHIVTANNSVIDLNEIIRLCGKNGIEMILGGIIPKNFILECKNRGIEAIDYYDDEALQLKNALPSAEGAIMLAMEHSEITVSGMKALVCGYGRVGALLSQKISNLGACVTVAARRDEVICEVAMNGFDALKIDSSYGVRMKDGQEYDVIFNTVPEIIFKAPELKKIKNKPIYIEIASTPGGIDIAAARDAGIKIISAPSIPGKYSPISAGRYIFETVSDICLKRGIKL